MLAPKNLFKMKFLQSLLYLTSFSIMAASADISEYLWKKRVIVINHKSFGTKLEPVSKELSERDVIILYRPNKPNKEIKLFGKDGGLKWQGNESFNPKDILRLIDSMPMRQSEMKKTK